MARAGILELQKVRQSKGRCPWRMEFQADDIPLSAFFRLPAEIAGQMGKHEVSLIAIPILCDLAAEVRPREVNVLKRCGVPPFKRIFDDAVGALLVDQDAFWRRSSFTSLPALGGEFARAKPLNSRLASKRVVLGFSGGKDSVVSLFALLEAGYEVHPVLLNEGDRTWQDIRGWIPGLKRLGLRPMVAYLHTGQRKRLQERYGDRHYSSYQLGWVIAVLALCAVGVGAGIICIGVEASADASFFTFRGRQVNHQYQKTTRHLKLLERFYQRVLNPGLRIGSPIADSSDSDVLRVLLEKVPTGYQHFSSCGGSNWRSKHCGKCEKCAFVYALLSESASGRQLAARIFRRDLLEDVELYRPWIDARFRLPQACVGSRTEVWRVLEALAEADCHKAVVRRWKESELRRRMLAAVGSREVHAQPRETGSPLTWAIMDAANLVGKWIAE
jgi:7-cyano-7-deazaguanine synthase in queuosine biosynthesis